MPDIRLYKRGTGSQPKEQQPRAAAPKAAKTPKAAKLPPPTPEQSQSLLSKAGGVGMSGLHTVGSILSTPSRVLWGTVNGLSGGEGGFGNMNPLDSTGGIEASHVLGNAGVISKNDPHKWEWGDVGRGLVDMAGDPTAWLPIGALTRGGQAAARGGALARGPLNQIRAGQRGLIGFRVPLAAEGLGAIGTGHGAAAALEATRIPGVVDAVSRTAPIVALKRAFNASAMGRTTHGTQQMAERAYEGTTHQLNDANLTTLNTARNMELRQGGPIAADADRHMVEMGIPSPEIRPLQAAVNAAHARKQDLGIPTGDLANTVKAHTKYGAPRAVRTIVLDRQGNPVRTIDNSLGGAIKADAAPFNYLAPNQEILHAPRQIAEGTQWGGQARAGGRIAMDASANIDQKRNVELFGNASTDLINRVFQRAGQHLETLPAGLTANQRAREIARMIKREFKGDDLRAGTNLTGNYVTGAGTADQRVFSRPRELGQFIEANPQLTIAGPFTNHVAHDMHTHLVAAANQIPKAEEALRFMGRNAAVNTGEALADLRLHRLDNPPTMLEAAAQLGLNPDRVIHHVTPHLPAATARDLGTRVTDWVTAQANHIHSQTGVPATAGQIADLTQQATNRFTLELQLPGREYASLTGFMDHAPVRDQNSVLAHANTVWKANMLAHPATQTRNAVSAGLTGALAGHLGLGDLHRGIQLQRGQQVGGLAAHPDVAGLMAAHGIDETEALRRLVGTHLPASHTLLGDLPPDQIGSRLQDITSNVPGKAETALHEIATGPAMALAGYRDGQHVGINMANPLAIGGAFGHERTAFAPAMASNMAAQNVEQSVRGGSMIGLMRQGYTAAEAARKVGAAQVNYGNREFSQFEKQLKQYIPFYAFGSRAGKHVATELATDPGGRMAQLVKAQDRAHANDLSVPNSILSGTAIPLEPREDGTKRFLTGLGLQHEPAVHTLGALAHGDFRGAGYDLLGMTNPLVKTPLEHITGQSFYQRGEPAANLDPNIGRTLSNLGVMTGLRDEHAGPVKYGKIPEAIAETALALSPLSRIASTARTLTDTRKNMGEKLANTLTGLRITDVSPKKQQFTLIRRAEDLAKSEGAKARSDVYFNKADMEDLEKSNPKLAERQKQLQGMLNSLKASTKKPTAKKEPKPKVAKPKKPKAQAERAKDGSIKLFKRK